MASGWVRYRRSGAEATVTEGGGRYFLGQSRMVERLSQRSTMVIVASILPLTGIGTFNIYNIWHTLCVRSSTARPIWCMTRPALHPQTWTLMGQHLHFRYACTNTHVVEPRGYYKWCSRAQGSITNGVVEPMGYCVTNGVVQGCACSNFTMRIFHHRLL